jgi:hypothetical protein
MDENELRISEESPPSIIIRGTTQPITGRLPFIPIPSRLHGIQKIMLPVLGATQTNIWIRNPPKTIISSSKLVQKAANFMIATGLID